MWSRRRPSVSYTPKKFRRPSILMKARITTVEKNPPSTIKVVVRVRPPNEKEANNRQVVKVLDENTLLFDPEEEEGAFYVGGQKQLNRDMLKKRRKNKEFEFDQVFDEGSSNDEVFQGTTSNFIASLLDGYNCSVFVYGATGAGKTFTMLGNKEAPGIAYLTMQKLYMEMSESEKDYAYDLKISYLEVYNETVKDLINPSGPLNLRDDGKDGIVVAGIKTHQISCADELFNMLEHGNRNRTQHPTDANAESSRSHAVFQVHLRSTHKLTKVMKVSKLTMIDLAGSERGAATGGKGARFSEGSNINKSLLALGNCVDALAEGHKHVPYRNSKLTRILKDSLGGNCKTIMVVNVAPSNAAYEETFNTLQYASRAKKINLKARKNVVDINLPYSQYKKINEDLRAKIEELEEEIRNLKNPKEVIEEPKELQVPGRSEEEIYRAKDVLKCLYELEGKHSKELLQYKMKICILKWRLQQKESVRERLCFHNEYVRDSLIRIDKSMERLEKQQKSYKDKVRAINKAIQDLQRHREIAIEEIRNKGLFKDLQKDIESYDLMMKYENNSARSDYFEELIVLQHKELNSGETIINMLCQRLNFFYDLLYGYGKVTNEMKNEYMQLVQHLVGVKAVTWGDGPDEYATLRKVMELKCTPNSSAEEGSSCGKAQPPTLAVPESNASSPVVPNLEMTTEAEDSLWNEVFAPSTMSQMNNSSFLNKTFENSPFRSPYSNPSPLASTFSKDLHLPEISPAPDFSKEVVSVLAPSPEKKTTVKSCESTISPVLPHCSLKTDTPKNDDLLTGANKCTPRYRLKIIHPRMESGHVGSVSPQKENKNVRNCTNSPSVSVTSPKLCRKIDLNGTFVVRPPKMSSQKCMNETFVASPLRPGAPERENVVFVGSMCPKTTSLKLHPGKMKTFVTDKPLYLRRSPKSPKMPAPACPPSKKPAGVLTERNKFTLPSGPAARAGMTKTDSKGKLLTLGQITEGGDGNIPKENLARQANRLTSASIKPVIKLPASNAAYGYPQNLKKIPRPCPASAKLTSSDPRRTDKSSILPR